MQGPAPSEIYALSLHDALPICRGPVTIPPANGGSREAGCLPGPWDAPRSAWSGSDRPGGAGRSPDRKSTRLNSSHSQISYAVFCLKKKKTGISVYILGIEDKKY